MPVMLNTGGFSQEGIESDETRENKLGVCFFSHLDVVETYYQEVLSI